MSPAPWQMRVLLSRLTWPSGMVRERACRAIAGLLGDPEYGAIVQEELLAWIEKQKLESMVCIGVLCLLRARLDTGDASLPDRRRLEAAIGYPSVASSLLISRLFPDSTASPGSRYPHSGTVPKDFEEQSFFLHNMTQFLPPVYRSEAEAISGCGGISFLRQWGYEWACATERANVPLNTEALRYAGRPDRDHLVAFDCLLSEVYRSSFLRSLAWAVEQGTMTPSECKYLSARTLPIDLGLWAVNSVAVPDWWPRPSEPQGAIDTIPGQIWRLLSDLYVRNVGEDEGWTIAYATGRVHEGKGIHDLTIRGCFQRCVNPTQPDLPLIAEWCDTRAQEWDAVNELQFEGRLENQPPAGFAAGVGGWDILPCSACVRLRTVPRWQHWRGRRGIHLPCAFLGGDEVTFRPDRRELLVEDDGGIWAKWLDWPYRLREKDEANLSPSCGQHLLVCRNRIDAFSAASGAVFCWICKLDSYSREHGFGRFEVRSSHQTFGESRICRP